MNIHNMYKDYGDASQIRCKYYAKKPKSDKKKKSPFSAVHQNSAFIICIV